MNNLFEMITNIRKKKFMPKKNDADVQLLSSSNDPREINAIRNEMALTNEVNANKLNNSQHPGLSISQRLGNYLLGKQAPNTDNVYVNGSSMNATVSDNPRTGGLFRDITGGFKENYTTPAKLENFGQNTLPDGRQKGFGYRVGEGLGSIARLLESPLGRGLATAGIVGATGGNGLEALAYGSTAGVLNQQNRTNDRIYRDDLIRSQQQALKNNPQFNKLGETEQQAQLQNVADNINSQRGYINKDIYTNLINTQQLRDNNDWRKFYYDDQKAERQLTREWQKQEEQMRREDAAANRAVQMRGQDLNYKSSLEKMKNASKKLTKAQEEAQSNVNQMNAILKLVTENPDSVGFWQGINPRQNKIESYQGVQGNKNIITRTVIDEFRTAVRHTLTGAQFSAKEIKEYEKFLPNTWDNSREIEAKLNGLMIMYNSDPRLLGNVETNTTYSNQGKDNNYNIVINQSELDKELKRRGLL